MQLKIKDIQKHSEKYFSLIFKKPSGFSFYPGQYLDIKLPVRDPNGDTRAFTISSSPTENFLMITPKKGSSPFKKYLEKLKAGDNIESSHPAGTFILDETEPAVFITGGVGITPFRSMLRYAVDQKLKKPIILIYTNADNDFLFKEELDIWKKKLNLTIDYHNSSLTGHLAITQLATAVSSYVVSTYYLAGSHGFVNNIAELLIKLGVDQTSIRYDRFDGY